MISNARADPLAGTDRVTRAVAIARADTLAGADQVARANFYSVAGTDDIAGRSGLRPVN